MEGQAVVVAVLGEQPEILDGLRGVCREELDLDWALVGLDDAVHAAGALGAGRHLRIACRRTAAGRAQEDDTREKKPDESEGSGCEELNGHDTRIGDRTVTANPPTIPVLV